MAIYFILYLYTAVLVLQFNKDIQSKNMIKTFFGGLIAIIFIVVIGYRDVVGGDWLHYLNHFNVISYYSVEEILKRADPGYYIINWFFAENGFRIYEVNLICGIIFIYGLFTLASRQPNPWLALAVSIPYIVVVIGMGYSRQAVAIGLVMWGLVALENDKFKKFLVLVSLAATFHKSAVLLIGLGVFVQGKGKILKILSVILVGYGMWVAFLADYQERLWDTYVTQQMQSQGALVRVVMNLIPALIFLFYRKKWKEHFNDHSFWQMIALGSVLAVFIVGQASTAVDRVSLYFTPLQIVVFSRLPVLAAGRFSPKMLTFGILAYYFLVLFVWLNYATHSQFWIPYQNILWIDIFG